MPHVATAKCVDPVWFMARPLQWRSEERVTGSHHFPSEDDSVQVCTDMTPGGGEEACSSHENA